MTRMVFVGLLTLAVTACAAPREMPRDASGSDAMKLSPCACVQVPFEDQGFTWLG